MLAGMLCMQHIQAQNVPQSWIPAGCGGGGAVYAPSIRGNYGTFRLYASPYHPSRVVVSGYSAVYYSADYGAHFTPVMTAAMQGTGFLHLAGVFFKTDTIFVSTDKGMIIFNGLSWEPFISYATAGIPVTGSGALGIAGFSGASKNGITRFFATALDGSKVDPRIEPRDMQYFKKFTG